MGPGRSQEDFSGFDPMAAAAALYQEVLRRRSEGMSAAPRAAPACPNPGVSAASDMLWAKAAATQTGAGTGGQAAGGSKQQAPRKRKLTELRRGRRLRSFPWDPPW